MIFFGLVCDSACLPSEGPGRIAIHSVPVVISLTEFDFDWSMPAKSSDRSKAYTLVKQRAEELRRRNAPKKSAY